MNLGQIVLRELERDSEKLVKWVQNVGMERLGDEAIR